MEGQLASTLESEWLPIHWKAQHLWRRLERPVGSLPFLPDDAVAGGDVVASSSGISATWSRSALARLIDHLQIEDDSASLDFPGFDPTVEDADRLGEGGGVRAGG